MGKKFQAFETTLIIKDHKENYGHDPEGMSEASGIFKDLEVTEVMGCAITLFNLPVWQETDGAWRMAVNFHNLRLVLVNLITVSKHTTFAGADK